MNILIKRVRYNPKSKSFEININDEDEKQEDEGLDLKNNKKLNMLLEKGIELSNYPSKMIKLLLDGDYNKELKNYKSKAIQFAHELIEKKFPITKIGINTNLYKLVLSIKKDLPTEFKTIVNERKPRRIKKEEDDEMIVEEPLRVDVNNDKDIINRIYQIIQTGDKLSALNLLSKLSPTNKMYNELYRLIFT
jgi:hypothetical protein